MTLLSAVKAHNVVVFILSVSNLRSKLYTLFWLTSRSYSQSKWNPLPLLKPRCSEITNTLPLLLLQKKLLQNIISLSHVRHAYSAITDNSQEIRSSCWRVMLLGQFQQILTRAVIHSNTHTNTHTKPPSWNILLTQPKKQKKKYSMVMLIQTRGWLSATWPLTTCYTAPALKCQAPDVQFRGSIKCRRGKVSIKLADVHEHYTQQYRQWITRHMCTSFTAVCMRVCVSVGIWSLAWIHTNTTISMSPLLKCKRGATLSHSGTYTKCVINKTGN